MTKKKKLMAALSLLLVLAIAFGVTLALLSQRTNDEVNNFSVLGGLDVELDENWDPDDGEDIMPGDPITKEPYMVNNSDATTAYVGMQVFLVKGNHTSVNNIVSGDILKDEDYKKLLRLIEIKYTNADSAPNFNTAADKWRKIDGNNIAEENGWIFMYDTVLDISSNAPANQTEYLFKEVTLSTDATSTDIEWIKSLGGFSILLRGAAVQADGTVTAAEAQAELLLLFGNDSI